MTDNPSTTRHTGVAVAQLPLSVDEPIAVTFYRDRVFQQATLPLRFCAIGWNATEADRQYFYFLGDPAIERFTSGFNTISIPAENWSEPQTGVRPISAINEVMITDWLRDYDAQISANDVIDEGLHDYASPRLMGGLIRHLLHLTHCQADAQGVVICPDAIAAHFYEPFLAASPQTPHLLKLDWLSGCLVSNAARKDAVEDLFDVSPLSADGAVGAVLPALVPISETKLYVSRVEAVLTDALVKLHDAGGMTAILPRPEAGGVREVIANNPLIAAMELVGHGAPVEWVLSLHQLRLDRDSRGDETRVTVIPLTMLSLPAEALSGGFDPFLALYRADQKTADENRVLSEILKPYSLSYPGNARPLCTLFFDADGTLLNSASGDFSRRFGFTYPARLAEMLIDLGVSLERGAVAAAVVWHDGDALPAMYGIEGKSYVSEELQKGSGEADQSVTHVVPSAPVSAEADKPTAQALGTSRVISEPHISNIENAYAADVDESGVGEQGGGVGIDPEIDAGEGEFVPELDPAAETEDYDEALNAAILHFGPDLQSCIESGGDIQPHMLPGDIYEPEAGLELFFDGSMTNLGRFLLGELLRYEDDPAEAEFWNLWADDGARLAAQLYTEFYLRKPFDSGEAVEDEDPDEVEDGGADTGGGDEGKPTDGGEEEQGDSLVLPRVAVEDPHDVAKKPLDPLPIENRTLTGASKNDTGVNDPSQGGAAQPGEGVEHQAITDVLHAVPGGAAEQAASVIGFGIGGALGPGPEQVSQTDQKLSTTIAGILRGIGQTEIGLTDADVSAWARQMMAYADAVDRGEAGNITDEDLDKPVAPKTDAGEIATLTLAGCMFVMATAKELKAQRKKLMAGHPLTLDMLRAWDWEDGLRRAAGLIEPAAKDDEFDALAVTAVVARWHAQVIERIAFAEAEHEGAPLGRGALAGLVISYLLSAARDRVQATSERAFTEALAALKLRDIPFDALPEGWETMEPEAFRAWATEDDQTGSGAGGSPYAASTRAMLWFTENVMPRIRDKYGLTDDHPAVVGLRESFVSEASEDATLLSIDKTDVEGMAEELGRKLASPPDAPSNRSGLNG